MVKKNKKAKGMKRVICFCVMALCAHGLLWAENTTRSVNMQMAVQAFAESDLETAIDNLSAELDANPTNGYAHALVASIVENEGYKGSSLYYSMQAIRYLPKKDKEVLAQLYILCAQHYANGGDSLRAAELYDQAINVNPKRADSYLSRARFYEEHEDYQRMLSDAKQAVKYAPQSVMAYVALVQAELGVKDYLAAKQDVATALIYAMINDDKDDISCLMAQAALIQCGLKDYDMAIHAIRASLTYGIYDGTLKAIQIVGDSGCVDCLIDSLQQLHEELPDKWVLPIVISDCYEMKNDYVSTLYWLHKAQSIESNAVILRSMAIDYQNYLGDAEQAERCMLQALELDSANSLVNLYYGEILYDMGRYDEAVRYIRRSIELGIPEDTYPYQILGHLYLSKHDYDEAIACYQRQLVASPTNEMWAFRLGRIYQMTGDSLRAESMFTIGRDMMGDKPLSAEHYADMGDWQHALELADSYITNDKNWAQHYNLACVYARTGVADKALAELQRAFEQGMGNFYHISWDEDLDSLRALPEFAELLQHYQTIRLQQQRELESRLANH